MVEGGKKGSCSYSGGKTRNVLSYLTKEVLSRISTPEAHGKDENDSGRSGKKNKFGLNSN